MGKTVLASFQWLVFILAGTIVAPISVAHAFGLSGTETAHLLQRTFFVMGLTSILQGVFGHKLPLMEGPAGLWWGIFLTYSGLIGANSSPKTLLSGLEMGLFASGILFIVLAMFKVIPKVQKLFTPTVTGVYLLLLILQLSGPFIKGILGADHGHLNGRVAFCALITLILSIIFSQSGLKFLKNYSVLISLVLGWALFAIFGLANGPSVAETSWISLPGIFSWGRPTFNSGIIVTSLLTGLLLLTNMIASMSAVENVIGAEKKDNLNRSGWVMGINQMLSGVFPTVGGVPISGSAGFILTTQIKDRLPFLIGSALILIMSFFPLITGWLSALPAPVGYATLFMSMASIIGLGLKSLKEALHDESKVTIMGISIMAGAGIFFVPGAALNGLPSVLVSLLNNGLIIGVVVAVILEQLFRLRKADGQSGEQESKNK